MRKSIFKIALTLLLAFIIGFASVPIYTYAANNTSAAEQKKIVKKYNKWLKSIYKDTSNIDYQIKYKKSGKRYDFTLTIVTKQLNKDQLADPQFRDLYNKTIISLTDNAKTIYKKAKKMGLKKPNVYVIWVSSDGYQMTKHKNGKQIE